MFTHVRFSSDASTSHVVNKSQIMRDASYKGIATAFALTFLFLPRAVQSQNGVNPSASFWQGLRTPSCTFRYHRIRMFPVSSEAVAQAKVGILFPCTNPEWLFENVDSGRVWIARLSQIPNTCWTCLCYSQYSLNKTQTAPCRTPQGPPTTRAWVPGPSPWGMGRGVSQSIWKHVSFPKHASNMLGFWLRYDKSTRSPGQGCTRARGSPVETQNKKHVVFMKNTFNYTT
jgi:hypothetical protein